MAEKDIVQNMISQLGQSQEQRLPKALDIHFAQVDERTTEDLLRFAKRFSTLVNFHRHSAVPPTDDWTSFFSYPDDSPALRALRRGNNARTPPHLALFLSFLKLYRQPRSVINRFTGRHLDFYYRDVLRLKKKPAVADKAHVLVELKKKSPPIVVSPENVFSAGKDKAGVELIYAPTSETVVNVSKVESLRSIFLDPNSHGAVHYAPIANSSDGAGGKLTGDEPKWRGFGSADLPFAEVGFAVASPVLRMKEGARSITVTLTLASLDARFTDAALRDAFNAFVTAEKSWAPLDISSVTPGADGALEFALAVREGEKAIVDYAPAVHGYHYTAQSPVLQFLWNPAQSAVGYDEIKNVTVQKVKVAVAVQKITSLNLESDAGVLDAKKVFLPFGPQPAVGSLFSIGCAEALSKKLSKVEVTVQWKGAPASFATHYLDRGCRGRHLQQDDRVVHAQCDGAAHFRIGTRGHFRCAAADDGRAHPSPQCGRRRMGRVSAENDPDQSRLPFVFPRRPRSASGFHSICAERRFFARRLPDEICGERDEVQPGGDRRTRHPEGPVHSRGAKHLALLRGAFRRGGRGFPRPGAIFQPRRAIFPRRLFRPDARTRVPARPV